MEIVSKIQERWGRLGNPWPLANETLDESTEQPVDELIMWMDMILHRTTDLLSTTLVSVIG